MTVRIGLIGAGGMGRAHLARIAGVLSGGEIVAVADINHEAAVSAAQGAVPEEGAAEALAPGPAHAARALELRDAELGAADAVITPRRDR